MFWKHTFVYVFIKKIMKKKNRGLTTSLCGCYQSGLQLYYFASLVTIFFVIKDKKIFFITLKTLKMHKIDENTKKIPSEKFSMTSSYMKCGQSQCINISYQRSRLHWHFDLVSVLFSLRFSCCWFFFDDDDDELLCGREERISARSFHFHSKIFFELRFELRIKMHRCMWI